MYRAGQLGRWRRVLGTHINPRLALARLTTPQAAGGSAALAALALLGGWAPP